MLLAAFPLRRRCHRRAAIERLLRRSGGDGERALDGAAAWRASERTTSPLQMGQVRRRVVSHGVLLAVLCQLAVLS